MRNVAVVGASDDSIDADPGNKGNLQYVAVAHGVPPDAGDSIIELDSPPDDFSTDARPQTELSVVNFTFIQGLRHRSGGARARRFRESASPTA